MTNNEDKKGDAVQQYLTPSQVAKRLNYHQHSVARLCSQGKIPAIKIFGQWRIPPDAVDALIAQAETAETLKQARGERR